MWAVRHVRDRPLGVTGRGARHRQVSARAPAHRSGVGRDRSGRTASYDLGDSVFGIDFCGKRDFRVDDLA